MNVCKWIVLVLFILMYGFVIAFKDKKVWFSVVTALFLIAVSIIIPNVIFPLPEDLLAQVPAFSAWRYSFSSHVFGLTHSFIDLIRWDVLLMYLGFMCISAVVVYSKIHEYIAAILIRKRHGAGAFILLFIMAGLLSAVVQNAAVVIVFAPIIIALCREFKIQPVPYIIMLTCVCSFEGASTLVGDPSSMIVASFFGYGFSDFIVRTGSLSVFWIVQAGMLAGCFVFYLFSETKKTEVVSLPEVTYFGKVPAFILGVMIAGLVLLSFIPLNLRFLSSVFVFCLGLFSLAWYKIGQKKTWKELKDFVLLLDWKTLFYLMGVFVVAGALGAVGILKDFSGFIIYLCGGSEFLVFLFIIAFSFIISAFIDNLPFIVLMIPVISTVAFEMGINTELLIFALMIGSCAGGCLTPLGSGVNILVSSLLSKEGYKLEFKDWAKTGIPFAFVSVMVSALTLWFVWA